MAAGAFPPLTIERAERALLLLAKAVDEDGAVYAPLFETVEAGLAELRRRGDPIARARQLLQARPSQPAEGAAPSTP